MFIRLNRSEKSYQESRKNQEIKTHLAYVLHKERSGAFPKERKNGDHKIIEQIKSHQEPGFGFIFVVVQVREVFVQNRVGLVYELRYGRIRIGRTIHFG